MLRCNLAKELVKKSNPAPIVMAGFDPAIQMAFEISQIFLDSRIKCGHDTCVLLPVFDFFTRSKACLLGEGWGEEYPRPYRPYLPEPRGGNLKLPGL